MIIPHWLCFKTITRQTNLVPLVLEPRNRPLNIRDSKETTVTVIKINCPMNRCTFKYILTRRAVVYWQFSKLLNQPLYPQISVDIEKKALFWINRCSHIYILLYMCILHVHWYLHFDNRLFLLLIVSQYIEKGRINHLNSDQQPFFLVA